MFKRTALAVLAALAAVLCCSLSSCKGAGPEQEESVPYYTVEYSTEKVLIDVIWDAQPGDIDDCAENAQLIAVIKILGLGGDCVNTQQQSGQNSAYDRDP